jgi:hypothetical protein
VFRIIHVHKHHALEYMYRIDTRLCTSPSWWFGKFSAKVSIRHCGDQTSSKNHMILETSSSAAVGFTARRPVFREKMLESGGGLDFGPSF